VKFTALALADDAQRFAPGYPPKGAWLLMHPNDAALRLSGLAGPGDRFRYADERVEQFEPDGDEDLLLIHVDVFQEGRARTVADAHPDLPLVFFGRQPSRWGTSPPAWVRSTVTGDPAAVWAELRADAAAHSLKRTYTATGPRHQSPDRGLALHPDLNASVPAVRFARGCACPGSTRNLCAEWLECGGVTSYRAVDEVVGEVLELPGKRLRLLDEDVAANPDYYTEVFTALWNLRREWTVNASDRLFAHPRLVRLLAKAGVRLVTFNDSLLIDRLPRACADPAARRRLYRLVKSIQAARIIVAARVPVDLGPAPHDFEQPARVLAQVDLDIIDAWFYHRTTAGAIEPVSVIYRPGISPADPAWLKERFYSLGAIIDRTARRPRRVGFYSTAVNLLPRSLAERQDFYEGMARS
jgi:hypothetical protein